MANARPHIRPDPNIPVYPHSVSFHRPYYLLIDNSDDESDDDWDHQPPNLENQGNPARGPENRRHQAAVNPPNGHQAAVNPPNGQQAAVIPPNGQQAAGNAPNGQQAAVNVPNGQQADVNMPNGQQAAVNVPNGPQEDFDDEEPLLIIPSPAMRNQMNVDEEGPDREHIFIMAVDIALGRLGHGSHSTAVLHGELLALGQTSTGFRDTMLAVIDGTVCSGFRIRRMRVGRGYRYYRVQVQ